MIVTLIIISLITIAIVAYLRQPKFGKAPAGNRLELIKKSANYANGIFKNVNPTPQLTEGYTIPRVMYNFLFQKTERRKPVGIIPSVKTNLLNLPYDKDVLIWFGHSSYFIQLSGKRFLIDPVLSGNASPLPGTNKAFKGTDIYSVDDLPVIDYLLITHDHYDHLDYDTLVKLKSKIKKVICPLGVGAHLEYWGYAKDIMTEVDRNEKLELNDGFSINTESARHFSGRSFKRNNTLWLSYILQAPALKIYIGGDSGYDTHFADIGNKYGPFDLAILENGQYNKMWRYIHATPAEVLQATHDLKARRVLPVHSGKFAMSSHHWDEPLVNITALNNTSANPVPLVTPLIGETVNLADTTQVFKQWWVGIK